jgi:hypothetical protein
LPLPRAGGVAGNRRMSLAPPGQSETGSHWTDAPLEPLYCGGKGDWKRRLKLARRGLREATAMTTISMSQTGALRLRRRPPVRD